MSDNAIYWAVLVFGAVCFLIGLAMGQEIERRKHG